jgi:hypothetical protein
MDKYGDLLNDFFGRHFTYSLGKLVRAFSVREKKEM